MKLVYIAGPYRGKTISDVIQNIRNAEKIAIKYWKMGYAVICPHKNTALFDGLCEDKVWMGGDIEILKRCDIIVLLSTWKNSTGTIAEYEESKKNNIEIIFDEEEF